MQIGNINVEDIRKGYNKSNKQLFSTQAKQRNQLAANLVVEGRNKEIFFAQRNAMEIRHIYGGNYSYRPKSAIIYNPKVAKKPKFVTEFIRRTRNCEHPIHNDMIRISELLKKMQG